MNGRIHEGIAYSLIGLGGLHTLLTPVFYPDFSANAIWFAGTGLALVFLGSLNVARARSGDPYLCWLCLIANLVGTAFCAAITRAIAEPQAYLAVGLTAAVLIASLRSPTPAGAAR